MLWEFATRGKEPFEGQKAIEILNYVAWKDKRLPIPKNCPEVLAILMMQCWNRDPHMRPNFQQIWVLLDNYWRMLNFKDMQTLDQDEFEVDTERVEEDNHHHHKKHKKTKAKKISRISKHNVDTKGDTEILFMEKKLTDI